MMEQDQRNFCLSVAGHSFSIHAIYTDTYYLCKAYLTDQPGETEIKITKADLDAERKEADNEANHFSNAYLETLAVYRKISEAILQYDTFLMHGAVVASGKASYMFTAVSGTGKTTHVRKWLDNLPEAYVVNGDKPLIRITDNEVIACGTPWCGKENYGTNAMVPLKAIVLMERGENNEIQEVTFGQAFTGLLQQTYMPADAEKTRKTLALLAKLQGRVKFYKFVFNNMKDDAFDVSYKALHKE